MPNPAQLHEDLSRPNEIREASDRSFGALFSALSLALGLLPLLRGGGIRPGFLIAAATLAVVTVAVPRLLRPFKRVWLAVGKILHRIISPIVLALLFYVAVVPTAMFLRVRGRRPLALDFDRSTDSYWIHRRGSLPAGSMKKLF
jgi:hypothetical protein